MRKRVDYYKFLENLFVFIITRIWNSSPWGEFLHSYEEAGGNMGRGANLYIKHELIDCIPVYHALYSHFDTFELIERNSY